MSTPHSNDRHFLQLALEGGEILYDHIAGSEIAKAIPVVGTAIEVCKGMDSVRNRMFVAKLTAFIDTIEQADEHTREQWRAKCASSPEELHKVGETVLIIIDRADDVRKAEIFGVLFLAFTINRLSAIDLARLVRAVDACLFDDLQILLDSPAAPERSRDQRMQYLSAAGLTVVSPLVFDDDALTKYDASSLGKQLALAYYEGRRVMQSRS